MKKPIIRSKQIIKKKNLFYNKKHSSIRTSYKKNAPFAHPHPSDPRVNRVSCFNHAAWIGWSHRGESSLINLSFAKMKISKTYIYIYVYTNELQIRIWEWKWILTRQLKKKKKNKKIVLIGGDKKTKQRTLTKQKRNKNEQGNEERR